jgi:putative stress-induced transcription regulator
VELMNTIGLDRDGVRDALESDADVTAWLRAVEDRIGADTGITLGRLDEDAVRPVAVRMREVRDALRRLAAEMTEDPRPPATAPHLTRPDAITRLNTLAGAWPEPAWPPAGDRCTCSARPAHPSTSPSG